MLTCDELIARSTNLPAGQIAHTLCHELAGHDAVVVTAPPGAGKSTLLPLTLLASCQEGSKVLLLEPRRLAARQIAERMASLLEEPVGTTVGYRVRFETKVSTATRLEVLTEGILTRLLIDDPTLDKVEAVIFDEYHERSLQTDLALALTRQVQQLLRPDLKIVIMSATLDTAALCHALHAPQVTCDGKMFPVTLHYAAQDATPATLTQTVAATICQAFRSLPGDILAFLPGQGEILRCAEMLEGSLGSSVVQPLYGNLSPEQQQRAIAPSLPGERKVVLATPIAETSLTIEGVRIVVDGGFCRTLVVDPRTSLSHLETVRISKDMATQRMGRAGRLSEGACFRLWTLATQQRMTEQRKPEMLTADLASLLLSVVAFGERDVETLPWITPPPAGNVAQARRMLSLLGALDDNGNLTPLGHRMAALPCHPRIARMMLCSDKAKDKALACDIAALLEEKDPLATDEARCDLTERLALLRDARRRRQPGRWARHLLVASEYRRMAHVDCDNSPVEADAVGALVAHAYPERVALSLDSIGNYRLSSGEEVHLESSDPMTAHTLLAIASLHATPGKRGRVFLAAPVTTAGLEPLMVERENLSWDSKRGCLLMQRERRIGKLLFDSHPDTHASREKAIKLICDAVTKEGRSLLDWNDAVTTLQRRVAQVALWHPEMELPDLSTEHLLATTQDWLPPFLEGGTSGGNTLRLRATVAEMKKIDLSVALYSLLPYNLQQEVERLAPSHLQVPTGSRIRVDYRLGSDAPVLSVRLQECFGLQDTPRVDGGRRPVLMELLSPGFKPVQLTQDLQSFWQHTYFEVRKELKRRYPKHYWPDNPTESPAVRGTRVPSQKS